MVEAPALAVGDHVRLRRSHPCGSFEFVVEALGADIRLRCQGCQHRLLLDRVRLERRMRGRAPAAPGEA